MDLPDLDAQMLSWLVVDVAALNWGLQEAFSINLVTDYLPADLVGPAYLAVGVLAAVSLASKFDLVDVFDS
jgi:uncharacterized membrane protein YuzA (DUF378 family)